MPDVTKEQVKEIFAKHQINSIDDLAGLLVEQQNSPAGAFSIDDPNQHQKSWIIKVWEIKKAPDELNIRNLPENLGGDILNR